MKYCEEIVKKIERMLRKGTPNKTCADAVGIGEATFYEWMDKPEFSERVNAAKAKGQIKYLNIINKAMKNDWKAAKFMLETVWSKQFGRRVVVSGDGGQEDGETSDPIRVMHEFKDKL